MAGHPLAQVTHHEKTAIVGLAGLGGVQPCQAGGLKIHTGLIFDRVTVAEHAHAAFIFHKHRKGFAGGFHRHQPVQQAHGFGGAALGGVGIAAVYGGQRVVAQIPHGGTVGGDGVADTGQLGHHRRQVAQRAACGGHDGNAPVGSGLQGGLGAGRDLALVVEQGAVQVQRDQTDGGNIL